MGRIKLRFEVFTNSGGQPRLRKEAFELTWEDSDSLSVDTLYIQVINTKSHSIFHTFLAQEKAVHTVPLRFHEDPSQYRVHAYGLKQVESLCYNVQSAAGSSLDNLLTQGHYVRSTAKVIYGLEKLRKKEKPDRDLGQLPLVPDYQYEPLQSPEQTNCGIDFHLWDHTRYVFTGFQRESHYIIVLHQMYSRNTYVLLKPGGCTINTDFRDMTIPLHLPAARDFTFQSFRVTKGTENSHLGKSHSAPCQIRTCMAKYHVQQLFQKARLFVEQNNTPACLSHFYRNKPFNYFQYMRTRNNGIMYKQLKISCGDPYSSLNKQLEGLFFSAHVDQRTLCPPHTSPFGDTRLYVPVHKLLNPSTNLYFSDFYCHYFHHKVQLVVTNIDSLADEFCKSRLIQLDPYQNPFCVTNGLLALVASNVTVELFCADDFLVPLTREDFLQSGFHFDISYTTRKTSNKTKDILKKKECTICNLDHIIRERKQHG